MLAGWMAGSLLHTHTHTHILWKTSRSCTASPAAPARNSILLMWLSDQIECEPHDTRAHTSSLITSTRKLVATTDLYTTAVRPVCVWPPLFTISFRPFGVPFKRLALLRHSLENKIDERDYDDGKWWRCVSLENVTIIFIMNEWITQKKRERKENRPRRYDWVVPTCVDWKWPISY